VLQSREIALLGISLNLEVVMQTGRGSKRGDKPGEGGEGRVLEVRRLICLL